MEKQHQRDEWTRDIDSRQRNVVFPDTVVNEGRFWRNIIQDKQRLSPVQKIGIGVLGLVAIAAVFEVTFLENDPWSSSFSWNKLAGAAIGWVIAFAILGAFLLLFSLSQRPRRK